jgi:hypothetical protein
VTPVGIQLPLFAGPDWTEPEQSPARIVEEKSADVIAPSRLMRRVRERQVQMLGLRSPDAPRDRSECVDGPRPCKWTDCRHHLWAVDGDDRPGRRWGTDDTRHGVVRQHSEQTCALDVASAHPEGASTAEVARVLGVTEERVRQIEEVARGSMLELTHLDHHQRGDCLDGCVWC